MGKPTLGCLRRSRVDNSSSNFTGAGRFAGRTLVAIAVFLRPKIVSTPGKFGHSLILSNATFFRLPPRCELVKIKFWALRALLRQGVCGGF